MSVEQQKLDERSLHLRKLVVSALEGGGKGHIGSALSLIEILRVLYDNYLKYRPREPNWPGRDRCILSKGHGCLALYVILADKGFFCPSKLKTFCQPNSDLGGHPERHKLPGVEASTGALGHGLSIGVGMALAARIAKRNYRVVVITGDGELNEGSNWEAALHANKHQLSNLTVIVDYNKFQCFGSTKFVLDIAPLKEKFISFGFSTVEVDGHNVDALCSLIKNLPFETNKPSAIICHTIKGKGLSFAENKPDWHYKHTIDKNEILRMYDSFRY